MKYSKHVKCLALCMPFTLLNVQSWQLLFQVCSDSLPQIAYRMNKITQVKQNMAIFYQGFLKQLLRFMNELECCTEMR